MNYTFKLLCIVCFFAFAKASSAQSRETILDTTYQVSEHYNKQEGVLTFGNDELLKVASRKKPEFIRFLNAYT